MGEESERKSDGPTEEEKEAVRRRFAEMKAAKSRMQHPKEKFTEERQRKIIAEVMSKIPEERKASEEEELILKKPAKTWQDHVTQGMIHYHLDRKYLAEEPMLKAHSLNPTAMIPLYYLVLLTDHQVPFITDLDKELKKHELDLPSMFMLHCRFRDLVVLYRSVRDEWMDPESYSYLPPRYQNIATMAFLTLFKLGPSPLLVEIANRIESGDLRKYHWSYDMFTEYSKLLEDCDLKITMEEYFVSTVRVALEKGSF